MQPFVLNRHGRLVLPSNVFPELDFSVIRSQDQLDQWCGATSRRRQTNRFAATMYDKQPTRWGDMPRRRDDASSSRCSPPGRKLHMEERG